MQVRHLYDSDVLANMPERKSFALLRDSVKFDDPDIAPTLTAMPGEEGAFTPRISLLKWLQQRLSPYAPALCPPIVDLSHQTWADGRALRCLLHKYRPDLLTDEAIGLQEAALLFTQHFDGAPTSVPAEAHWPQYLSALHHCLQKHNPAFVANVTGEQQFKIKICFFL